MTASATAVSVSNQALLGIGARATIASLNEGSTESSACSILYNPTFEMLARAAPWNCLRKQATLTLLAAAEGTPENPDGDTLPLPPTPWLYSYAVPSDSVQIRFIVPTNPNSTASGSIPLTTASVTAGPWLPGMAAVPFAVAYGEDTNSNPIQIILCNLTQAQAVYTVNQPNPVIWDSMFQQAFVASMSAFLVPALSLNMELAKLSVKMADGIIQQARIRDGNEGITCIDHIPDWMQARNSGASLGWGAAGYAPWVYANYSSMSWPV